MICNLYVYVCYGDLITSLAFKSLPLSSIVNNIFTLCLFDIRRKYMIVNLVFEY